MSEKRDKRIVMVNRRTSPEVWETIDLKDLKHGDVFRMFNSDGSSVRWDDEPDGATEFKVTEVPCLGECIEDPLAWRVACIPMSASEERVYQESTMDATDAGGMGPPRCMNCNCTIERWADDVEELRRTRARLEEMEAALSRVRTWTHVFGHSLCPEMTGSADTYGDGVRAAKAQVLVLLGKCGTRDG